MNRLAITDHDPQGLPDDPRAPAYDDRRDYLIEQRERELRRELWTPERVRDFVMEAFTNDDAQRLMAADIMLTPALLHRVKSHNDAEIQRQIRRELDKMGE